MAIIISNIYLTLRCKCSDVMHAVTNLVHMWISHAGVIIVVSTALYSYMLALYLAFPPSPQKRAWVTQALF